jgi:hypothetical protein
MAFRTIQQVLTHMASGLHTRCAALDGSGLAAWRFEAEVAPQQPVLSELDQDKPLVVLQTGAGQHALRESLHPCFTYSAELVAAAQPDSADGRPSVLLPALAQLEIAFRSYLSTLADSALVDPADGVAGVYVVQAYAEKAATEVSGNVYLFKIPFTLVLQF